jgi:hypothetical protein
MELERRARLAGGVGIAAGTVWLVNWTYLLAVDAAEQTVGWYAGEIIAATAILSTAALVGGLWWVRAGGTGRFARTALAAWTVGWLLVFGGAMILIATGTQDNPLFPIGGILGTLAGIASGIVIVRADVLDGWRRWMPLAWALWYGLVLGAVMALAEHTWLATAAELVQYLLILLTGAGLATARLSYRVPAGALEPAAR